MQAIRVFQKLAGIPPVFDVPSEIDALIVRHRGQDYCLTDGVDHGAFIRWHSEPCESTYCDHIDRVNVA